MKLVDEIEMLKRIYCTLKLISTKGEETIYMANCLNALADVINNLESQNMQSITIPIDEIKEE